jgi:membrane-bound lytic murein transglycosylase D
MGLWGGKMLNQSSFRFIILVVLILNTACARWSYSDKQALKKLNSYNQTESKSKNEMVIVSGSHETPSALPLKMKNSSSKSNDQRNLHFPRQNKVNATVKENMNGDDVAFENEKEKTQLNFESNHLVGQWIHYFSQRDSERFQRFLNRGQKYKDVVGSILKENDLPEELFYLAMIESGYSTKAHSTAKALGVWQFIPATARRYGLQVNKYVDERRDPVRATESAAKYLGDLYNVFHSWELAMAAYNCGEMCVLRAVMAGKTRNFWELVEKGFLPQETKNYVPKFMAAVLIGKDPENYGLTNPSLSGEGPYPSIEAIEVPSPMKLHDLAKMVDLSLDDLKEVNPHLSEGVTPPSFKRYEVWVPKQQAEILREKLQNPESGKLNQSESIEQLMADGHYETGRPINSSNEDDGVTDNPHFHVVKRGETLGKIASLYGVSSKYLRKINGLKSRKVRTGKLLRISTLAYQAKERRWKNPSSSTSTALAIRTRESKGRENERGGDPESHSIASQENSIDGSIQTLNHSMEDSYLNYRVRNGDTLKKIARRFKMGIESLKKLNGLKRNMIYIGQLLKVIEK